MNDPEEHPSASISVGASRFRERRAVSAEQRLAERAAAERDHPCPPNPWASGDMGRSGPAVPLPRTPRLHVPEASESRRTDRRPLPSRKTRAVVEQEEAPGKCTPGRAEGGRPPCFHALSLSTPSPQGEPPPRCPSQHLPRGLPGVAGGAAAGAGSVTRSPEQGCLTHSRTLNHSEPMGKAPRQVLPQAPARPPVHTCFSRPRAFLHYLGREKNTRTQMLGFQGTRDRGQLSFCVPNVLRKPCSQDVVWGSGAGQAQSPQGSRRPGAGVPGPRRGHPGPMEGASAQPPASGANVWHRRNARQKPRQQPSRRFSCTNHEARAPVAAQSSAPLKPEATFLCQKERGAHAPQPQDTARLY